MQARKILVTGSSGTIGTRLCEKLIKSGKEVVGVDREPNKWNKRIDELSIIGDLLNSKTITLLPTDIDMIIHLAANARVYNLVVNPVQAMENIQTTFNMLEFARKNKIKSFLFASSREVYGNTEKEIYSENETHINSIESPYSASKLSGEALVRSYKHCYNQDFIIFRFSNVYGMYDDSNRVIPLFIRQCKSNKTLTIFGKEKLLDFTYIDDTIKGIISAITRFDAAKNETYNLAYGEGTSIVEVAKLIKKKLNSDSNLEIKESRTGEVQKYIADIEKARRALNYKPRTNIREGIGKSIRWYEKN